MHIPQGTRSNCGVWVAVHSGSRRIAVSTFVHVACLVQVFEMSDADRSNLLTFEEFRSGIAMMGVRPVRWHKRMGGARERGRERRWEQRRQCGWGPLG